MMTWRSVEESALGTDTRPLRDILAQRKELIAKYVPPETRAIHDRAMAELKERRLADNILRIGEKAAEFELPDDNGKIVSSANLLAKGSLVISFIRGRWCPFCVGQMEAMNGALARMVRWEASFVAISPQTVKQSFFMHNQHKLCFPLLSDSGNKVARQFGLTHHVNDEQHAVYRRTFVNLPFVNGDETWELPIPATYILGRDRTVLYASANEDYTERPEPDEIVDILERHSH